ncbi:MAG: hypothetical protein BWY46_01978 [Firmicutes bacterium ADurb.Bin300]|nr:MAG: hypothetical protein BWY46_01978 [Firmicutes bacterium ADurb.Bin300]
MTGHGGTTVAEREKMSPVLKRVQETLIIGSADKNKSSVKAGKDMNVGHASIQRAKKVVTDCIPIIGDMVRRGELTVNAAKETIRAAR